MTITPTSVVSEADIEAALAAWAANGHLSIDRDRMIRTLTAVAKAREGKVKPHAYFPSPMHMGDCVVCGHEQHSPLHATPPASPNQVNMRCMNCGSLDFSTSTLCKNKGCHWVVDSAVPPASPSVGEEARDEILKVAQNFLKLKTPTPENPVCTCAADGLCLSHEATNLVRRLLSAPPHPEWRNCSNLKLLNDVVKEIGGQHPTFDFKLYERLVEAAQQASQPEWRGIDAAAEYLCRTLFKTMYSSLRSDGRASDQGYDPWYRSDYGAGNARQEDYRDVVRHILSLLSAPPQERSKTIPPSFDRVTTVLASRIAALRDADPSCEVAPTENEIATATHLAKTLLLNGLLSTPPQPEWRGIESAIAAIDRSIGRLRRIAELDAPPVLINQECDLLGMRMATLHAALASPDPVKSGDN